MALSATFTANFASFYDAVDKAEAKLKDFGAGADKVGGRLNALANSFSGVKIIQDATLMVKAVEQIGGVTKLTEKELARLGATANEAVAKMKALGMDVPKNLQQIADQTKKANTATTDWMGTLTKIAGAIGIAFSVDAVVGFISSIFDAASAVKDLSLQWGVSTKFVQQWSAAAKTSGVDSQTLGKSIQFVTEKLSESSEAYDALLANIGLSGPKLRQMPLEEAYRSIIKAIEKVEDKTLQLDVTIGLLGPSGKQSIGAIRDGLYDAADAQEYMADQSIQRLADMEQKWKHYKEIVKLYSGEALVAAAGVVEKMTSSWDKFFSYLKAAATSSSPAAAFLAKSAVEDYTASLKKVPFQIDAVASHGTAGNAVIKTTAQILEELRKKREAATAALGASTKATKDAQAAQDKYNQSIDDLVTSFGGGGVIDKANLYVTALQQSVPIAQMTVKVQKDINAVMWEAIVAFEAAGQSAPKAMYDIYVATAKAAGAIKDFQESLPTGDWITPGAIDLGEALTLDPGYFQEQLDMLDVLWDNAMKDMAETPVPVSFEQSVGDLSKAFAQLGEITGGVFGDMTADIAQVVGAMNVAAASTKTFQSGLANFKAGNLTTGLSQGIAGAAGIASAFQSATKETGKLSSTLNGAAIGFSVGGPWGAAVGAAAGLIKGFINAHKEAKEVKKLRNDFIEAAGGIDVFTKSATEAGVSLDALYHAKKKTDLEAAITDVTKAFQYQQEAMGLVIETAQRYGFTLEELGPALAAQELDKQAQQIYKDWQVLNTAGIDAIAITERMGESVSDYVNSALAMGLEVPAAMRPMLESFAKAGTLVDANGEAITDLEAAGISFTYTMSDGFKALITEVKSLTDAITRSLGLAIKNIPQPKITGEVTWDVAPIPAAPSHPHGSEEIESYQGGTDGYKNFGKGTPVMLHGWEAVVPREESGAFATVSGGGGTATSAAAGASIVINAQGAFFDTPGDLQRLADRVNEALTAKFGMRNAMRAG